MNLKPVGMNRTELETISGIVFFSYQTPVAFRNGLGQFFRTETNFSRTTEKHITQFLNGNPATVKPQSFFDKLVAL